jgi:orotidine-5'-phosphate decarboxylase
VTTSRVIVALDFASADDAREFAAQVTPMQCRLKVGLELYTVGGPSLVRELIASGFDVFLDLKFHDIPNTVERACRQAVTLGVWMLTVHCLGGRAMLEAARRGVGTAADRPRIVGVTLLTSHDADAIREIGFVDAVEQRAQALGELARAAGLDGVVCAPTEAQVLRQRFGHGFLLVTPGIRPAGSDAGDQQRVLTPAQAIAQGADWLVVGRPVTRAADPRAALAAIEREIAAA